MNTTSCSSPSTYSDESVIHRIYNSAFKESDLKCRRKDIVGQIEINVKLRAPLVN